MSNTISPKTVSGYDGITWFTQDQSCIDNILGNEKRYSLAMTYEAPYGERLLKFEGKYNNISFSYVNTSKGNGVRFGGSLHKWKNKTHNYDTFYWDDFEKVYNDIVGEFKFDPTLAPIWSLEIGLNNNLPESFQYKAKDFPRNTIFLKGEPKVSNLHNYKNDGFGLKNKKGECLYKLYDKGRQYNVESEIVRAECRCKKRPLSKHGLVFFADLLDYDKHLSFAKYFLNSFDSLILFQPESLDNPDISVSDRVFLLEHNIPHFWTDLRKKSDYLYKKDKSKYLSLIDKYCKINYRTGLLNLMRSQLF